ncbi:hypothetical protein L484_012772 [Morus notabilis]|uniref:Uncharacterized protein n=1 Tax=Morus notabilis TaxID=981085 RepID=W9SK72_9ROSA|nr:hypothetical protein L484_012772 [Morus notabilis]
MPRKTTANRIKFGVSSSNRPPAPATLEPPAPAMPPPDYDIIRFVSKDTETQYERRSSLHSRKGFRHKKWRIAAEHHECYSGQGLRKILF